MGGSGSGQTYWHWWRPPKKRTVESCLSLDANRWTRDGVLKARTSCRGRCRWEYPGGRTASLSSAADLRERQGVVTLEYARSGGSLREPDDLRYTVCVTSTMPRFGGLRWWFVCPLAVNGRGCGRRVGKLYLPDGARYFGCRRCHDLVYTSSQEARKPGAMLARIAAEVGCSLRDVERALRRGGKRHP